MISIYNRRVNKPQRNGEQGSSNNNSGGYVGNAVDLSNYWTKTETPNLDLIKIDDNGKVSIAIAADKLSTGRNIGLVGDVTGSTNFDGTSNKDISTNIKSIDSVGVEKLDNENTLVFKGNIVATGNVVAYGNTNTSVGSIIDNLPVASTTNLGIAQFSPTNFNVVDGIVSIKGESVGLNVEQLASYLDTNNYTTENWVLARHYLTSYTETDPTVPTHVKGITTVNISNWNTAYDNTDTINYKNSNDTYSRYGLEAVSASNTFAGVSSGYICTKDGSSYFKLRAGYADNAGKLNQVISLGDVIAKDLNTLPDSVEFSSLKFEQYNSSSTNTPTNANDGLVVTHRWSHDDYAIQIASDIDGTGFSYRSRNSVGTWSTWGELYSNKNSNKSDVDWSCNDLWVNGGLIRSSKISTGNNQVLNPSGEYIYIGNPSTKLRLESSDQPYLNIGGSNKVLYSAHNANSSAVDWTAKDLYTDGFIRVKPSYQIYWGDDSEKNFFFNNGTAFLFRPTTTYRFTIDDTGTKTTGTHNISKTGDGATLLQFSAERTWGFKQRSTGASTILSLEDMSGAKSFRIYDAITGTIGAYFTPSGGQSLFSEGVKRFETRTDGTKTTGNHEITGHIKPYEWFNVTNTRWNKPIITNSWSDTYYDYLLLGTGGNTGQSSSTIRISARTGIELNGSSSITGNLTATGKVISKEYDFDYGSRNTIAYQFYEGRGWGYNSTEDTVFYNAANGKIPFEVSPDLVSLKTTKVSGTTISTGDITVGGKSNGNDSPAIFLKTSSSSSYIARMEAAYNWATPFIISGYTGNTVLEQQNGSTYTNLYAANTKILTLSSTGGTLAGTLTATGDVTAYSDMRLKTKVKPLTNVLGNIDYLEAFYYTRKDTGNKELHIGTSAQAVQKLYPEFVNVGTDKNKTLSLDYGKLGATIAIQGLKEAKSRIEQLEREVKELRSKLQ